MERPETIKEEIVCDGKIQIEKGTFRHEQKEFERYRILRQDASVILLFDRNRKKVILTRQFRYPVAEKSAEDILEIVAGKIDAGELPSTAANREVQEETGYTVREGKMYFLTSCYVSPGYTTERFHFFFAEVSENDKESEGGGLEEENETIELVELDADDFIEQVKDGRITDAKTILAGLWCESRLQAV